MMSNRFRRSAIAAVAALTLPLALTACGSDDDDDKKSDSSSSEQKEQKSEEPTEDAQQAGAKPFGPGCASVPESGKGSFNGMAKDPVATAASNNPELSTLVTAVKKAGLVDTLNNAENITVFAPTNAAFEKIPEKDLNAVLSDKKMLTDVLTYHVVGKKLAPKDLESGTYPTLQKSDLKTAGSGEEYKVNDNSTVVCGNVPTANATVYLVDTVLMPKK
ncbi:fasciclin domain-containing protein [Streptomyces sp. NPDC054784]